jgi:Ser/Thr protein kinase RdoA (MazF antagonist)
VYRVHLDDGQAVIAKFSSYGSYFLFCEDHDRIHRCKRLLYATRYRNFLADALTVRAAPGVAQPGAPGDTPDHDPNRVFTYYDGRLWAAFYEELERKASLPKILTDAQIDCLGREMALFHLECARLAPNVPLTSKSLKSDAIHLLEMVTDRHSAARFALDPDELEVVRRHAHEFLTELERISYDYWAKIPVLIDWNLGNFSVDVKPDGQFSFFSRWDYDWFRIEPRMLDFYFLSRVSSSTGDRTHFTYSPHTLVEPRFQRFLAAYHAVYPMTEVEVRFLKECYRFFVLNYVIAEGDHFFVEDLWRRLQKEAVHRYLPLVDALDLTPLLQIVR